MFPGMSSRLEKDIASCVDTLSVDKTKEKIHLPSTYEDLKALYLQNVLRGDTSRANKFRVHVEAYGSVWCLGEAT